jgi:adenosyl cobinamide kinase/adenosyl cobinamide phosphate guanylyltransferase
MDPLDRAWREMNGRTLLYLAGIAESVERLFCGIPQKIK